MFVVPTVCTGHCSNYQFMCDDGCCIDITYACDGRQHCPDRSDEDFCSNCEDTFAYPTAQLAMPAENEHACHFFSPVQSTATGSRWPTCLICRISGGLWPRRWEPGRTLSSSLGHKRPWTDLRTVARLCKAPVKWRFKESLKVCLYGSNK